MKQKSLLILCVAVSLTACTKQETKNDMVKLDIEQTVDEPHEKEHTVYEMSFFETLQMMENQEYYDYNLKKYIGYEMVGDEDLYLDQYGFCSSRVVGDPAFRLYTRNFVVGNMGVSVLFWIVKTNENRLEKILDITTFKEEGQDVYFSSLWESKPYLDPPEVEDPYRLGVSFYQNPSEVESGVRIPIFYIIDMDIENGKLNVHKPEGEEKELFLYQDPNPV
ncbi:MAG: hypothetical protein PQJ46_00655 [Spirochaetales bacterium]|nr:hypothetical protein [Spirochaetales bacterium]